MAEGVIVAADEYTRLIRSGVPNGYATRMVLSHHLGGWKPCEGVPQCEWCKRAMLRDAWTARHGRPRPHKSRFAAAGSRTSKARGEAEAEDGPEHRGGVA
jgi:hypothetical protein